VLLTVKPDIEKTQTANVAQFVTQLAQPVNPPPLVDVPNVNPDITLNQILDVAIPPAQMDITLMLTPKLV
jgi:hypothetical protein